MSRGENLRAATGNLEDGPSWSRAVWGQEGNWEKVLEEEAFELGLRRRVRFGVEEMGDLTLGGGY